MDYKYCKDENFEDFACGRVIMHRPGMTNYPVRLAVEIYRRCLEHAGKGTEVSVYDPCCGGGYLMTVLGFLNPETIGRIYCSDVNSETADLARNNLSLLTESGLLARKQQILQMADQFHKPSHMEALSSADRLLEIIRNRPVEPGIRCFTADALDPLSLKEADFKADIVVTDVPYGELTSWSDGSRDAVGHLLENLIPVLRSDSVIAISSDKGQKARNDHYHRLEKFKVGKRQVEILRLA